MKIRVVYLDQIGQTVTIMASNGETTKRVSDLQTVLRERGLVTGSKKLIKLAELRKLAKKINIEIDPDGLIENICEKHKLSVSIQTQHEATAIG